MPYLPVFGINSLGRLRQLPQTGLYGVLATTRDSTALHTAIKATGKPFYLDCGIFDSKGSAWHLRQTVELINGSWQRQTRLIDEKEIAAYLRNHLEKVEQIGPTFAFAPDIFGEPLLSLHLARLARQIWQEQPRSYELVGVVQAGQSLYHWQSSTVPGGFASPPDAAIEFVGDLVDAYRAIGFSVVALGGLLKADPTMPMGWKFGLNPTELDQLLQSTKPDFVLGGLALSRVEVLRKHQVAADSTNWLWWSEKYDAQRFQGKQTLTTVIS